MEFEKEKLPEDDAKKLKYLYRMQEKLRLLHNSYGANYRSGTITEDEFHDFQRLWFEPRSMLICKAINGCKGKLSKDKNIICDLDDIKE